MNPMNDESLLELVELLDDLADAVERMAREHAFNDAQLTQFLTLLFGTEERLADLTGRLMNVVKAV